MKQHQMYSAVIAVLLGASGSSQAVLLLHEDFEGYTPGPIAGQAGTGLNVTGTWSGNGNGTYTVGAGLSGSQGLQLQNAIGADNIATVAHSVPGWGSGQLWMSFLYNESSYGGHSYVSGGGGYNGAAGHAWTGGSLLGLHNTTNPGAAYTQGETRLLVTLIDWTANTTTLWVDPVGDPTGDPFDSQLAAQTPGAGQTLWFNTYNTNGTWDDIRIGTTYSDVGPIPEPSSLVLLGLAGVGCCAMRRRQVRSARLVRAYPCQRDVED